MLFNSIEFAFFLPIVFVLYWSVSNKSLALSNIVLLCSSYLFYGWWDWRFLSLILVSSLADYLIGIKLSKVQSQTKRKLLLLLSIIINIGFLGFFKYFNFFSESFAEAFTLLGRSFESTRLNIILPVGISFYTFQTLSYTIDVYRKKLEPAHDILAFFTFVSFFPQLVAGPIERATNLLSQFYKKRNFDYHRATDGLRQILWGLFKKVVIADNCAEYANQIFNNSSEYSGSTLLIGSIFFAFQIYGDFSGYSDIAIGTARLFGIDLMKNFAFPYFSRDIAEFWRRWHISLSTWFRDYLYIPLGGSMGGAWIKIRNIFIIFIVSGLWHGANWTFIIWGLLNALFFLPLLLLNKNRSNIEIVAQGKMIPSIGEVGSIAFTFFLVVIAWIFFRAESVSHAVAYISEIFSVSLLTVPEVLPMKIIALISFFMIIEWIGRENQFAIERLAFSWPKYLRYGLYYSIIISIVVLAGDQQEFIYFQF